MKLIKIFSEHTGEETRLYSVPRFQKEFNSKAQKNLLGKFYNNVGPKLKDAKVSNLRNEKNIRTLNGKGLTTAADNLKREFQSGGDLVSKIKTRRSKKNHKDELKVREIDAKLTRTLGGEKVWNRHLKHHLKGEKNFSSSSQKELRRRLDLEKGLEYSKLDPTKEYPKDIVDESIRRGRSLNSQSVQTKNLKERAKDLKKSKRIKFLKKGAKATAIGLGTVGVGVGIKKAVDNHKEKKLLKEYREQLKTYSIFSKLFPKKNENLPESNMLEIIENFPKIKKDIQNLQRNQDKIKELGEKLIDLGITNGSYHPGLFKETSWIDNSGWAILIEGTDMEGSLLINTKTGQLEDCMGNKFAGVPSYLKFLIKSTDTLLDPVLAKEDNYYIFYDSKKIYDDCVKVWKELKPLLK